MGIAESQAVHPGELPECESLFDRCSWFYAFCREHLFSDHTRQIARALFPVEPAPGTSMLELGCGPGFYACRLAQQYPQISATGFDLSTRQIEVARSRAARRSLQNCRFQRGTAERLPYIASSIDAIVISRLFLILPNKQAVLAEVFRVLREGGRCFIAEPASGFRTQIPLDCMWALARLGKRQAAAYREPRQVEAMTRPEFSALVHSQPWASVQVRIDGQYQHAVCSKAAPGQGVIA